MKAGIYIGRFQPIHIGHVQAILSAKTSVDHLYILIGSANQCRSIKNPWPFQERFTTVHDALLKAGMHKEWFTIVPLNDYQYSDSQWITEVRTIADQYQLGKPVLMGHTKEGNDYLKWFPDWGYREIPAVHNISATQVREEMFRNKDPRISAAVHDDWEYFQAEKEKFANYPYPETLNFNCADAVLECQGHVLLIQRKFAPGAGTWALPGGFKNRAETFLDCAVRELIEETNVRVPEKVLRGSIVKTELFDSPKRSFGINRNTLAVYMRINPNPDFSLPRANGADDAAETRWVPLVEALNDYELYDDHAAIISTMTGVMPMPALWVK